ALWQSTGTCDTRPPAERDLPQPPLDAGVLFCNAGCPGPGYLAAAGTAIEACHSLLSPRSFSRRADSVSLTPVTRQLATSLLSTTRQPPAMKSLTCLSNSSSSSKRTSLKTQNRIKVSFRDFFLLPNPLPTPLGLHWPLADPSLTRTGPPC